MSVVTCRHCGRAYWRYRRSHPPPYFCSVPCHDGVTPAAEQSAEAVLIQLRAHLAAEHGTSNILDWYRWCDECEALNALYTRALGERAGAVRGAA